MPPSGPGFRFALTAFYAARAISSSLMCAQPGNFFLKHQLFFLKFRNFNVVGGRAALHYFDMLREVLVFLLQFLQMRTQAHGRSPLGLVEFNCTTSDPVCHAAGQQFSVKSGCLTDIAKRLRHDGQCCAISQNLRDVWTVTFLVSPMDLSFMHDQGRGHAKWRFPVLSCL